MFWCELCDSLLLAEPINKHSNITGRRDEGMDQAGSRVAGKDEAAGLSLDVVVVQAVYYVEAVVLDEPEAAEL
ncbi:hypothetical protein Tco_0508583 [Tanacetum coccineum]